MGFIYKITSPTGKIYVGQTKRLKVRIWEYRWRSKKRTSIVHNSIRKYGWEAHTFEILEECDNEVLSEREIFWIKEMDSYFMTNPNGMNMTTGGEKGARSWRHDIERRKKMSEKFKGENGTFYGKRHTEEVKKILSEKATRRHIDRGTKIPEWGVEKMLSNRRKSVVCYDSNGYFVNEYPHSGVAASSLCISNSCIKDSLKYGSWAFGKYFFKYKTENYPLKIEVGEINLKNTKRPVYWLSEDLEPICEFPSAQEASEFFGIPKTTINRAAMYNDMNQIRTGHIFFYKDMYKEEYSLVS